MLKVQLNGQSSYRLVNSQTRQLADWMIRGLVNSPKCLTQN